MKQKAHVGDFIKLADDGILWQVIHVFQLPDGSRRYEAKLHGYDTQHSIYGRLSIHENDIYEVVKGDDA